MNRVSFIIAIQAADDAGYTYWAEALRELYRREFGGRHD